MRHNGFGEAYCHTSKELLAELERKDAGPATVYVTSLHAGDREFRASAEVADNVTGETVCYIEADTTHGVLLIARVAKLDTTQANER